MKKKKIMFFAKNMVLGGVSKFSIEVSKNIDKTKYDVDIVTLDDSREYYDRELKKNGGKRVSICKNKDGNKGLIAANINFYKLLKKEKYDVLYYNTSSPWEIVKYIVPMWLSRPKNVIIHSHNSDTLTHNIVRFVASKISRIIINGIVDYRLACSDKAAEWIFGENREFIQINNGIEVEKYAFNENVRNKIRSEYGFSKETLVFGNVGRIEGQKNPVYLVDIFEAIHKLNEKSVLMLVGNGNMTNEIKSYVKRKGLEQAVIFTGPKNNANELYQAFDGFLLPSLFEGLPIAGVEAQTAGLLCFFSDTISRKADITGNVRFLSIEKSPEEWAKTVILELENYSRKDQSEAVKRAHFDIKDLVRDVEKVLEKCK